MAFIYVITNTENEKKYIGCTTRSIRERFKEHIKDRNRNTYKERSLYSDMNIFGIDCFTVDVLEECDDDIRFEKEVYWINRLDTYHNGYNMTYGGDGKQFYNHKEISDKYIELGNVESVCRLFQCCPDVVYYCCKENGVSVTSTQESNKIKYGKQVLMYDKDNNYICSFQSLHDAARYCIEKGITNCKLSTARLHISEVCNNARKTFAKHKWKFA